MSDIKKINVNGTLYDVAGGSGVIANPELEGTEPDLEGLEVDGTKYKVPQGGGSALYKHYLYFQDNRQTELYEGQFYAPLLHSYSGSLTLNQIKEIVMAQGLDSLWPPVEQELGWAFGLLLDNGVILYLYGDTATPSVESGTFGIFHGQDGFTAEVELLSDTVKDITLPNLNQ